MRARVAIAEKRQSVPESVALPSPWEEGLSDVVLSAAFALTPRSGAGTLSDVVALTPRCISASVSLRRAGLRWGSSAGTIDIGSLSLPPHLLPEGGGISMLAPGRFIARVPPQARVGKSGKSLVSGNLR